MHNNKHWNENINRDHLSAICSRVKTKELITKKIWDQRSNHHLVCMVVLGNNVPTGGELRNGVNGFLTSYARDSERFSTIDFDDWTDSWHLALAIRYLHALVQEDPYICNHSVMYTLVRWYFTESHHKCSRMCLWRDVDMRRIIDEPEIVVTDYLRWCDRLLTNG